MGNERLESRAVERDLAVLVGVKLDLNQQCPGAQRANCVLGVSGPASPARDGRGLSCSALGWPHLKSWEQFWEAQYLTDIKPVESVQRRP